MTDICCIGHITLDEIRMPFTTSYLPGGTAWYFSNAISQLPVQYQLITAVADSENYFVTGLENTGVSVQCFSTAHTINFINSYAENQDQRTQKVTQQADPFTADQMATANASIIHLGPLLANDVSPEFIPQLAAKAKVSLDVQGYLRNVENEKVMPVSWQNAAQTFPYIYYLKASEQELEVLTSCTDIYAGAKALAAAGVKEVIVTLGSLGSVILSEGNFYTIPAYNPIATIDTHRCLQAYDKPQKVTF